MMVCSIEGCDRKCIARGFCTGHYSTAKKKGLLLPSKNLPKEICCVEGCNRLSFSGFQDKCRRHLIQFTKYGKTFIDNPLIGRSIGKPPIAIIEGDIAKIPICGKYQGIYAIVDREYAYLAKHKWYYEPGRYAYYNTSVKHKSVKHYLHHMITPAKAGYDVDHANRNKLDNRSSNLRYKSRAHNNYNSLPSVSNKSGFKGVCWDASKNSWRAYIGGSSCADNKTRRELGHYKKIEDAIEARRKVEEELGI